MNYRAANICLAATPFVIAAVALVLLNRREIRYVHPREAVCILDIRDYDDTTKGLITGYNYLLLEDYFRSRGIETSIRLAENGESPLDSLSKGVFDIVVVPMAGLESLPARLHTTCGIDSLTVWAASSAFLSKNASAWLEGFLLSEDHGRIFGEFMNTYNPFRRRPNQRYISPYDDIIRCHAGTIGWDWRLLSAIIFQESRFCIDAVSRRGAQGLMQMMPNTADTFGISNLLNPETSVRTGAAYLGSIYKRFRDIPDNTERIKFTVASYNAGENRIRGCIDFAREKGLEGVTWEEIVSIIPEMDNFKGVETTAYVQRVLDLYGEFCRICP